jgi:hypothetical protein
VDEIYVSLHEPEQSDNVGLTVGERVSRSAEKAARPMRKRKVQAKTTDAASSVPVYNDDELQHIPDDVLEWAGLTRPKKGRDNSKATSTIKTGKKRVLKESSRNVEPKKVKKPKSGSNEKTSKSSDKSSTISVSFEAAIENMGTDELIKCADTRYASLLSTNGEAVTFHTVTSSLTDEDTKLLCSVVKMLKGQNGERICPGCSASISLLSPQIFSLQSTSSLSKISNQTRLSCA